MSAEPAARFAARVAAAIFAGQALILLAVALLYRSELGSARVAVPALCGAVALLLLTFADRVYRAGVEERAARAELLRCAGKQFDSQVVAAFLSVLNAADATGSVRDVELA